MNQLPLTSDNETTPYLTAWKVLCRELLGWSENQVDAWVMESSQWINPFLGEELPEYYVAPLLVPEDLKMKVGAPGLTLFLDKIERTIWPTRNWHDYGSCDWPAIRARIKVILDEA